MPAVQPSDEDSFEAWCADWMQMPSDENQTADYYFNSYAHRGIHEDMLRDTVRTSAYQRAILKNRHLFEGKVVMDVGAGTGILSLFSAKAGARRVIAVEKSEVAPIARLIAADNDLGEVISVVQSSVEDLPDGRNSGICFGTAAAVVLPGDIKPGDVDIVVSEWMGYCLLYGTLARAPNVEAMLDSVLVARDKWMRPGGLMVPDRADIFIAGFEDTFYRTEKALFWQNARGFSFRPMVQQMLQEPCVETIDPTYVATSRDCILSLDLHTCRVEDLDFASHFTLRFSEKRMVHGFVCWFDMWFTGGGNAVDEVHFTTGPHGQPMTHWKQTIFYVQTEDPTVGGWLVGFPGETVEGKFALKKNMRNIRDIDVKIELEKEGQIPFQKDTFFYRLR